MCIGDVLENYLPRPAPLQDHQKDNQHLCKRIRNLSAGDTEMRVGSFQQKEEGRERCALERTRERKDQSVGAGVFINE
jgi:hypothetical protein